MNTNKRLVIAMAAALFTALPMTSAFAADEGGVTWVLEPYLWVLSIKTNLSVDVPPIDASNTTKFDSILDKFSGGFLGHAEVQGDNFGAFGDIAWLSLSDKHNRNLFSTNSSVDTSIGELAAVWSPGDVRYSGFEGFAGVRNFSTDFKFNLYPTDTSLPAAHIKINKDWNDFLIGARYIAPVSDHWTLGVRADGGFGDTDGNYNLVATAAYRTGNGAWTFAYRYMDTKFAAVQGKKVDLELYGPVIGYAFIF
jgi:hypothetical protein